MSNDNDGRSKMSNDNEGKKRGFAALTPEQRRKIASAGGKASQASTRGHQWSTDEAREAGRRGGRTHSREHMAEIGRKGGEIVSADSTYMAEIGRKGGLTHSREHMAEIGRRGGNAKRRI